MILVICLTVTGSIFFGELLLKNHVEKTGVEGRTKEVIGGKLLIRKHHNRGAVLNIGQKRRPMVAAVSLGVTLAAFMLFLFSLGQRGNDLMRLGLSLLLGGAFSNTYDRLKRKYVVDYFSFGVRWEPLRRIVFNFSDLCILTGALLTALGAAQ